VTITVAGSMYRLGVAVEEDGTYDELSGLVDKLPELCDELLDELQRGVDVYGTSMKAMWAELEAELAAAQMHAVRFGPDILRVRSGDRPFHVRVRDDSYRIEELAGERRTAVLVRAPASTVIEQLRRWTRAGWEITIDDISYVVRPHPSAPDGFEVWRGTEDLGSFALDGDRISYQGRLTGKIDEATMTRIAERFAVTPRRADRGQLLAALTGRHGLTPTRTRFAPLRRRVLPHRWLIADPNGHLLSGSAAATDLRGRGCAGWRRLALRSG
jgi:hypothetical protein